MKNDAEIKRKVEDIRKYADEYLRMPNACAYSDSILDLIVDRAERIKALHESNAPD